jgi:methylase of polypeptide subunit release factors
MSPTKKNPVPERSRSVTPAPSADKAGVFTTNRSRPIHRWYPFVEGYSSELVEWGLKASGQERPRILDPFGGSGTTALTAAEHGLDSWFCEVNPYLAWLADVKVNQSQRITSSSQLEPLRRLLSAVRDGQMPAVESAATEPFLAAEAMRPFFPKGVAAEIAGVLGWLEQETDGPVRELGRVAVAVSLVPSSEMIRRTDLRRRTAGDPKPKRFADVLELSLGMMVEDLEPGNRTWTATATQLAGDMRGLAVPSGLQFDLIITSPPYLNGTNYCRNTKLELLALGFISGESGLAKFRTESITAGINNVSKRRNEPDEIAEVEEVAGKLDEAAYDRRIPTLVRLYFSDMREGMKALRSSVTDSAELFLDIGDSRFAGVHVPTHELLAVVGSHAGWRHVETIPIRERRSYDGSKLVQVVLRLAAE